MRARRVRGARHAVRLALILVLGACGSSRGRQAVVAAPATKIAPSCPDAPALRGKPPTSEVAAGDPCPAGVCPEYFGCGCDATGRIVFLQHTYGGPPSNAEWIDYDAAGHVAEVRFDREADGRIDARSEFATSDDATCVEESRDDDLDGTIETICAYDHPCLVGTARCEPVTCAEAPTRISGRWCADPTCPAGARCACDARGRVITAYWNQDGDAAFEARTEFGYRGDDAKLSDQRWYHGGELVEIDAVGYDARGRVVKKTRDRGADGTVDEDERWTFDAGGGADAWTRHEDWRGGALASRQTRTYRDEARLTETLEVAGATPITARYFPGAGDDVVQPITLASALIQPAAVACRRDADCVVVHDTNCCDCSSGGTGAVVNRDHVGALQAALHRACRADTICLDVISDDPTCKPDLAPACVESLCTLRGAR